MALRGLRSRASYGFSFFPSLVFMARALRAWTIKGREKLGP